MPDLDKIVLNGTTYNLQGGGGGGGTPVVALTASDMVDTDSIYVYVGNETGYTYGDWYYYNGSQWVDSGQYAVGTPGYTPTVSITETASGVTITVTDENGTTSGTVENGTATDAQVSAWLTAHPEATTTVQDNSVTPNKTTFIEEPFIYDVVKPPQTRGSLNGNNGNVTPSDSATTQYSDVISIDPADGELTVAVDKGSATEASISGRQIALYKDGTFVAYPAGTNKWASDGLVITLSLSSYTSATVNQIRFMTNYGNIAYVTQDTPSAYTVAEISKTTFGFRTGYKDKFSTALEIGTPGSVTTEAIADKAVIGDKIDDSTVGAKNLICTVANNLLDFNAGTKDKYLGGGGQDLAQDNSWISAYIPVVPGKTYTFNFIPAAFRTYCFYNSSKTAVGSAVALTESSSNYDLTAPSGVAYIRVSCTDYRNILDYNTIFRWRFCLSTDATLPTEYSLQWLKLTDENNIRSSIFKDKIVLGTGDSITENNTRNNNKSWLMYLPEKLGVIVYNDGKSGTGLCKKYSGNHSILYRVENSWSTDYAGVTPDIVLIMANMNDGTGTGDGSTQSLNDLGISGWASTGYLAVGTESDTINTQSVYGCAKRFLEDVITKYPLAKIGWILSTPRNETVSYWTGKENDYGHGWFEDYITAIKHQCEQYNVPVLDLYHEAQFRPTNSTNMNAYMDDGTTHPNTAGVKKYLVDPIVKWLEDKFGYIS